MENEIRKRVKVCIRIRPTNSSNINLQNDRVPVKIDPIAQTISVTTNTTTGAGTQYQFDKILQQSIAQKDVYELVAKEVVDSVVNGYNGTILAYGQTGAGKTFSMSGGKQKFEDRGIIARSLSHIFQHARHQANDKMFAIRVSYLEIYNEHLIDLLAPAANGIDYTKKTVAGGWQPIEKKMIENLAIQELKSGQMYVKGLTRLLVHTEDDALDALFQGETNRTIAEHSLNAASTRSHCIFTIYIEAQLSSIYSYEGETNPSHQVQTCSKLNLVDLAGSERQKKTNAEGKLFTEAAHINKSLSFLEQVVVALGDKKRTHIPYRQSPLTNLLKDSLGGNCCTLLLACIWPDSSHNDQSLTTLNFATRMMRVKTRAIVNQLASTSSDSSNNETVKRLTQEIANLKHELALYDTITGRNGVTYDSSYWTSFEKTQELKSLAKRYLDEPVATKHMNENAESSAVAIDLPIINVIQIQQLFRTFRDVYNEKIQELNIQHQRSTNCNNFSNDMNEGQSKMVGKFRQSLSAGTPRDNNKGKPTHTKGETSVRNTETNSQSHENEKELYDKFIQAQNVEKSSVKNVYTDVENAKSNLRAAKKELSQLSTHINQLKAEIDTYTQRLNEQINSDGINKDHEEAQPHLDKIDFVGPIGNNDIVRLKEAKRRYREVYQQYQEKQREVRYLLKAKEQTLINLTRAFEVWRESQGLLPQG